MSAEYTDAGEAVPDMVLQVGGSISFAPEGDQVAQWQTYDTRHMLAEIDSRDNVPLERRSAVPTWRPSRQPKCK